MIRCENRLHRVEVSGSGGGCVGRDDDKEREMGRIAFTVNISQGHCTFTWITRTFRDWSNTFGQSTCDLNLGSPAWARGFDGNVMRPSFDMTKYTISTSLHGMVWHTYLLPKLSASDIQGPYHTWWANFPRSIRAVWHSLGQINSVLLIRRWDPSTSSNFITWEHPTKLPPVIAERVK